MLYRADLLTSERIKGEAPKEGDRTLVESFIRTATDIGALSDLQIVEHYGEVSRVLRHVRPLSSDQVAERVIQLYRRHSSEVSAVIDRAIRDHVSDIRTGKLPSTCAILLAIPKSYRTAELEERREPAGTPTPSPPSGRHRTPPSLTHRIEAGSERRVSLPKLEDVKRRPGER